jgi:hypothetical protein
LAGAAALAGGAGAGFLSALSAGQTKNSNTSGAAKYPAQKMLRIAGLFIKDLSLCFFTLCLARRHRRY